MKQISTNINNQLQSKVYTTLATQLVSPDTDLHRTHYMLASRYTNIISPYVAIVSELYESVQTYQQ